jgi:monoamine oxidase
MPSRRQFLVGAAAALVAGRVRGDGVRKKRVIVVGAGLAGLSAAHELGTLGHDVTVFEAQKRAGGRVLTLREPFSDGLYAEAGAIYVQESHDLTVGWCKQLGIPLVEETRDERARVMLLGDRRVVIRRGQPVQFPVALTAEEQQLGFGGMFKKYVLDGLADVPKDAAALDRISLGEWLRRRGASPAAVSLLRRGFWDGLGDGVDSYSAASVLLDMASSKPSNSYRIEGGSDRLPRSIAERVGARVKYGTPVTRIEWRSDGVRVTAGDQVATADHLVLAISFSVLRHLDVQPRFSAPKQRAVDELPYTSVARVYLQTATRFWSARGERGGAVTDGPAMWIYEDTQLQKGTRGILSAYVSGANARRVTALSSEARLQFAVENIEKIHPGTKAAYERGASKCWDEDPWARGDYCYFKPGQMTSLQPHIAPPEGRVHFAGDHASSQPGWMQGAFESAKRVAREIHQS